MFKISKIKNLFIYILSFAASAIGIFLNFFLARVLEAEAYGDIQYLVALATTCSQVLLFGINSFLIREAKNDQQKGEAFNKCLSLYIGILVFFIPIIFYYLSNFIPVTNTNVFLAFATIIASVLIGFNSIISAYFQGNGKYHLSIIFESLLPKLFLLITAFIFVLIGSKKEFQSNYLIFYIIFYSIVAVPFIFKLFKRINYHFSSSELKSMFFFFGVTVTYSLGNNLTKVLQGGLYKNSVALGIVSVSISIISLVKVITSVLDNMVKPIFAKKKRNNDILGLLEIYRFDSRANSYFSIPLYLFFTLHPSNFLSLFGESYLAYPYILSILAVANAINDITGPNGTMLAMTGKEKWELFNGLIYFGAYFLGIFIFSNDKIYGLSYALLIAQIVVNIAKYSEVWFIYKKSPLDFKTIISLLIIVVVNFIGIFALKFIHLTLWLWFGIGIFVGIVFVIMNFFLLSMYRKTDFKELINLRL